MVRASGGDGAVVNRRSSALARLACITLLGMAAMAIPPRDAVAASGISIRDVDISEFPTVRLIVSTREAVELSEGDVEVVENGLGVDVGEVHLLGEGDRVDAVLAIDVSNSMRGGPLSTALAAARTFVAGVPASMPLGVVTFSDEPTILSPLAEDRASVQRAVTSIGTSTSAGTALFDAVATAVAMFDTESNVQHNLILVTDGRNTTGDADLAGAVEAAQAAGMHVFTIGLAGPATDEATLRTLARSTGGTYEAISPDELGAVYAGLAREFSSQYVVEYRSKAPLGTAIQTSVHLPVGSASVGFLAPGASGLGTETQAIAQTSGFWAGSLGMGLIAGLTFLTVGALGLTSLRLDARRRRQRQLRSRLIPQSVEHAWDAEPATGGDRRASMPSQLTHVADRLVGGSGSGQRLARRLEHAGWAIGSGEFLTIVVSVVLLFGVLGFVLASTFGALAGVALGAFAPFAFLSNAAGRRLAAIQGQLADTLMVIASSMRAGHSFLQSLDSAAKEIDQPAAGEFGRVLREIRLGRDTDDALDALVERVGSQDLEWAVTAIEVQRKIGGNLAEVLETVANTIRERDTLRRQMRVLSAESRISVVVLTVLPILIAIYLMIVNPQYLRILTTTTAGKIISISALVLMGIGYLWMKRIVRLDV
jgi:tight adherence protein B